MPGGLTAKGVCALALFIIFSLWINVQAKRLEAGLHSRSGTALIGKEPPLFTLTATDGRRVSLGDYLHRKNLALVFWASWCGPCRMEMPLLKSFYEKARPMRDDFEILAVSIDEYADAATGAANGMHLPFPVLVGGERVADAYGVAAIPQTLIIDKSGKVTFAESGVNMGLKGLLAQSFGLEAKFFLEGANGAANH
jgi:thiol-disulfide isomerase/thioredoxin